LRDLITFIIIEVLVIIILLTDSIFILVHHIWRIEFLFMSILLELLIIVLLVLIMPTG
jgi:hypothetical protein